MLAITDFLIAIPPVVWVMLAVAGFIAVRMAIHLRRARTPHVQTGWDGALYTDPNQRKVYRNPRRKRFHIGNTDALGTDFGDSGGAD